METAERRAAAVLVAAVFLLSIYRAATVSLSTDEAFTWQLFLTGSPGRPFRQFDANNHVLHTALCRIVVAVVGTSEFTLRIPSLAGGLLYLVSVVRIAASGLGGSRLFLLAVALLSLNPLVLDHLSVARGYGLALGFFFWALHQMLRLLEEDGEPGRRLRRAALGLALAVAANLAFSVPATAMAVIFLLLFLAGGAASSTPARRLSAAVDSFIVPGVVVAFLILFLPLSKAGPEHFYLGSRSLSETLRSLTVLSLFHHPVPWAPADGSPIAARVLWFTELLVPVLLAAAAAVTFAILGKRLCKRDASRLPSQAGFLFLTGGTSLASLALLMILHRAAGVLYPYARTGIYFIPLFLFSGFALWKQIEGRKLARRLLGPPVLALATLLLAVFVSELQVSHYGEWRYSASTKKIASMIRSRQQNGRSGKVRVGVSWMLEPSLNFYRVRYGLGWMQPLDRSGPDGDYDYYVLLPEDTALVAKRGLRPLYRDPLSEALVAVPAARDRIPTR